MKVEVPDHFEGVVLEAARTRFAVDRAACLEYVEVKALADSAIDNLWQIPVSRRLAFNADDADSVVVLKDEVVYPVAYLARQVDERV